MNSEIIAPVRAQLTITDELIKALPAAAAKWLITALSEQHSVNYQDDDITAIRGLATYLFDEETLPDATQKAAIALKRANVISDNQFLMLLSMYLHDKHKTEEATQYEDLRQALAEHGFILVGEKNVFSVQEPAPSAVCHELPDLAVVQIFYNAIEAAKRQTKRYTLPELLAQCQPAAERDEVQQEWIDAIPVGKEKPDWLSFADVAKPFNDLFDDKNQLDHTALIQCLNETLKACSERGIALEIADFANELGLIFGRHFADKTTLQRDFQQGFTHGVDLARREEV